MANSGLAGSAPTSGWAGKTVAFAAGSVKRMAGSDLSLTKSGWPYPAEAYTTVECSWISHRSPSFSREKTCNQIKSLLRHRL